jgi:hypothetical protein
VNVQDASQLIYVRLASCTSQNALGREGVELADTAGQNFIARTQAGIGSNDAKVGSADGDGRSAVEVVPGAELVVVCCRMLSDWLHLLLLLLVGEFGIIFNA